MMTNYHACARGSLAGSPLLSTATRFAVVATAAALFAAVWLAVFPGKSALPGGGPAGNVVHVELPRVEVVGSRDLACVPAQACGGEKAVPVQSTQSEPDSGDPRLSPVNLRQ